MKMTLRYSGMCCLLLLALSCGRGGRSARLSAALDSAGDNRPALEAVLVHYTDPADSLQRRAAEFLVANMPGHYGYYGDELKKGDRIFTVIDSLIYVKGGLSDTEKIKLADSLQQLYGPLQKGKAERWSDCQRLSPAYLISTIDLAVAAWKGSPWRQAVSFEDFCEYILPYRIRDERVEHWRPAFARDYGQLALRASNPQDLRSVYMHMNGTLNTETNFDFQFARYYPFTQSVSNVVKGRIGSCETLAYFSTMAMRAAGVPVALDYIPHWGSTNSRHYMPHLLGNVPQERLSNENRLRDTWGIVDFSSGFIDYRHRFTRDELPRGMYIQYVNAIPKVYRYTFSAWPFLEEINNTIERRYIVPRFRNFHVVDVTDEYLHCSSILLNMSHSYAQYPLVYLCVFDNRGWEPVAVAKVNRGTAYFGKLGRQVVYLPMVFDNNALTPVDAPFYLDSLNVRHVIQPQVLQQHVRLVRKTFLFSYTAYHTEALHGGWFEGGNTPDFKDATVLHRIEGYPFYMNEINVQSTQAFRYLRYVSPQRARDHWEADNIAEVQFMAIGQKTPLTGTPIGSPGTPGRDIAKAFDNNLNSFYEDAQYKNGWIGLDLGEGHAQRISQIRFCPRNDTNGILPGSEYELFYWDNDWISLGRQTATTYAVDFSHVPKGALLWLRCHTEGREERIFTYEGDIQVWW